MESFVICEHLMTMWMFIYEICWGGGGAWDEQNQTQHKTLRSTKNKRRFDWIVIIFSFWEKCCAANDKKCHVETEEFNSQLCRIIINPWTARVIGAPQMILQPVFSIFSCSPLLSGTCQTSGLSIPWCCLLTSSSVRLVFFPLLPLLLIARRNGWL